jgi:hypothetical protein
LVTTYWIARNEHGAKRLSLGKVTLGDWHRSLTACQRAVDATPQEPGVTYYVATVQSYGLPIEATSC